MKVFLNTARIITGILFIFSGLIKANDPLGLSYKMQEFFEVWNLHFLHDYTLAFSIVMITFEIVAGVAVLLAWQMRFFSWLLLLLIVFFTFLTGYALFSGKIKECGCFGDCIPLKAHHSFIKDLVLLLLIGFIFYNRNRIYPALAKSTNILLLFFTTVFAIAFQWYVLLHLPVMDCLPYKEGNNIPTKMKIPPGAIPDSTVITFVYNYKGKEVEFTADKFPDDFSDTDYSFVRRYDKVVRKGNAEPAIKDFSLQTLSGTDTTQALLSEDRYQIYLFAKDGFTEGSWVNQLALINAKATEKNISRFFVTNVNPESLNASIYNGMFLLRCDATAIKTAARTNPALFLIRNGTILNKWSYADFDRALREINALK
jgi:uncharacterized membrane protein YphA (DoxX/SURF4 family)